MNVSCLETSDITLGPTPKLQRGCHWTHRTDGKVETQRGEGICLSKLRLSGESSLVAVEGFQGHAAFGWGLDRWG